MKGRVLVIAGSDSGGGAGIQADIKTVTALGGFAMTAITAVTVQNTQGVFAIHAVPQEVIAGQIKAVMEDLGADVIKIGMLGAAETARTVARALHDYARGVPVVLDPVMVAKGGAPLLLDDAVAAVKSLLLAGAVVTPNAPEAERLTGAPVRDLDGQTRAARELVRLGARAALVKGGHIDGPLLRDVLLGPAGLRVFEGPRLATSATHGTGCTLASALATGLAQGLDIEQAVSRARAYLLEAIKRAPGYGKGHGPLDHGWPLVAPP